MHIIFRILFYILFYASIVLICGTIGDFFIDRWEEKKSSLYRLKSHRKFLLKLLLISISGLTISGTFLF